MKTKRNKVLSTRTSTYGKSSNSSPKAFPIKITSKQKTSIGSKAKGKESKNKI
jgi:hypothetical protein